MVPHSHFDPPTQEGILWAMDGSRFQFAYKINNGKSRYGFLIYFIVMEAWDRKIIGYSYDDSENSIMVKKAIEMSCEPLAYLPREIITDNSPAFKSEDMVKIQALFKIWGGYWHKVNNNPRDNTYAERFFGVFQESFCKKYDGYLGDGIKSKILNGKPSPEEIKQYLSTKKLMTRDELVLLLEGIIKEYNSSSKRIASVERDYVNTQLKPKEIIEPIKLDTIRYSQLFWHTKELKVNHGEISFNISMHKYIYQIYDDELLLRIHGTWVKVCFNPKDLSKVLVFDLKNDEYLVTLNKYKKVPKAIIERTADDEKEFYTNLSKSKSLKKKLIKRVQDIYDLSEQNRAKLPPKLIEFGVGTKAECEESEKAYMSDELENLSKIELEKDVNEEADFESIFKKMYSKKGNLKAFSYGKN